MRLIDADALCTHIENEFDGVCVYDVSGNEAAREFCDIVDISPTIDAIPVEWLIKRRDIYLKSYHAGHECDLYTAAILNDLIVYWKKEHKA